MWIVIWIMFVGAGGLPPVPSIVVGDDAGGGGGRMSGKHSSFHPFLYFGI